MSDIIDGTAGDDILIGTPGDDQINGYDGHDTLRGNGGNDELNGGDGDDLLVGGLGDDVINGGAGYDRAGNYHINEALGGVTIDLNIAGPQNTGSQGWDTLTGIEYVSGTPFADTLIGDANDNILWGSVATIDPETNWVSTSNNDTLDGGDGNDLLYAGIGNHSLTGGNGIDTVAFTENWGDDPAISISLALQGAAQDTGQGLWTLNGIENLSGGDDDDQLTGDNNANILAGSFGNDTISGGGGNDTLYGDGAMDSGAPSSGPPTLFPDVGANGNDTLEGGLGDDMLDGGGGNDTASYANAGGSVQVDLGSGYASGADGNDALANIESVIGSEFGDDITGDGGSNVLDGRGGDDFMSGGAGDDTLDGGDGNDFLQGDFGENNLSNTGNDLLYGGNGNDSLRGGLGDDQLYGGANNDLLRGNGGVDYFDGGADDGEGVNGIGDRVSFYERRATQGAVADLRTGVISNDGFGNVEAMVGIESIGAGTAYADTFYGNDDRNFLFADLGDSVYGFGGDDLVQMATAGAVVDGGDGIDRLMLLTSGGWLLPDTNADGLAELGAEATSGWTVNLATGTTVDGHGNAGTVAGIENVDGSVLDDSLTGDGNANILNGMDGNDTLEGGAGNDTLDGGNGSDTASYSTATGGVSAGLDVGGAFGATTGFDSLHSIENIIGSAFNDQFGGSSGDNVMDGGDGHDIIVGRGGNDTLIGGDGDDYLRGDDGAAGDDIIDGGSGWDRAVYNLASTGVTVDLNIQGVAQDTGSGMDTLISIEHASGSTFDDTIIGDGGNNWLRSWGGNDTITGGDGNDLIETMPGNNVVDGGSGVDSWSFYGDGTFFSSGVNVSLALQGAAQDTGQGMMLATGFENLSGTIHGDTLAGDGGDNVIAGDAGSDTLSGGAGNDVLYGDGSIFVDWHGNGGSGPITQFADITTILGGVAGDDTLEGGLGDDRLYGAGGTDTASYANASGGVQAFLYNGGFGEAFGADGYDELYDIENLTGSAHDDTLGGNNGDNVLDGGEGHDFLRGNAGNDSLYGGSGDDYVSGGAGDDILDGGSGWDRVSFFAGSVAGVTVDLRIQGVAQDTGLGMDSLVNIEHVSGTGFSDTLIGDDGDNWLWGTSDGDGGNDTLDGQGGNDLLENGAGDHSLIGGTGIDTFAYSPLNTATGINVSLALQGVAQDTGVGVMTLTGIENLSGSILADTLIGDGGDNLLAGGLGDDTLVGGAGNDTLYGDGAMGIDGIGGGGQITLYTDADTANGDIAGNDTLEGGDGDDQLFGGGGSDTASYATAGGSVEVGLYNGGFGEAFGAAGYDQLHDIENLTGSAFNDILVGNNQDNILAGGDGHDRLIGGGGNDTLLGGDGNDYSTGGFGDDIIDGGAGFDRAGYYHTNAALGGVTVSLQLQGVTQDTGQGWDTLTGIEYLSGTPFADTLTGDDGDNVLWGSAATIAPGNVSAGNNDVMDGAGGNDLIVVGIGSHVVNGGDGSDTLSFTENLGNDPAVRISLELAGAGQDTLQGNWTISNVENLSGGTGNDELTGDADANLLAGYSGNDTLAGGAGNDTLLGDGLVRANATASGGGSGPIETVTDASVTLGVPAGNDVLEGGLGDDLIDGGAGVDTATYANAGGGVEAYLYEGGFGEAFGADGYDQLLNIENLEGGAFNDILFGNSSGNVLSGGDGHDFLQARGGDDNVYGGSGDDYLGGGTGNDLLDGGAGFDRASFSNGSTGPVTVDLRIQGVAQDTGLGMDTLIDIEAASGTAFGDTFIGNSGDNWLWGGSDGTGNDTLDGQEGNDLLEDGAGDHVVSGGDGIDTFRYSAFTTTSGIAISLALQGAAQDTGVGMMTLTGIENLSGAQFDDMLTGDGGDNVLAGSEGNDTLVGGAGNDTLYGDGLIAPDTHGGGGSGPITTTADVASLGGVSGNDLLEGGLGDDHLDGGGGIDTATYAHAGGGVNVNLGSGFASGADGNDTLANIENLIGSEFGDTLNGSGADNEIQGLGGNDVIQGQGGNDTIYGGDGDDTLRGDAGELSLAVSGDDIIHGGNGNDGLRGGLGNDQLYGDAGNDLLRGNGGVDYFDGGADDGEGFNGIGDRVSFFDARATQGAVADLRTGVISNDGFGNVESMVGIESLGADTAYVDTFYGNDGRNFIGGSRGDYLYGFGDNDSFQMGSAAAVVDGGSGIDTLGLDSTGGWLTPDADADGLAESAAAALVGWTVNLAAGTIVDGYGNSGSVTGIENVNGSQLGDSITGDANANVLNGNDGADTLQGGIGDDTLDGGDGTDTASYANASGSVTVTLTALGGSSSGADGVDNLTSIENVTGSAFNDTLIGNGGVNLIQGGGGHDVIRGGGGSDTLEGGDGDDFLRGDDGDDILRGGTGFDRVGFASSAVGVTVNLTIVGAQATGQGNDTFEGIENVSGTQFNDVITGDGGDNWLWGGSNGAGVTGNDIISGGGGNDLIEVGAGTHTLHGGAGTGDTLSLFGNGTDITAAGITYRLDQQGVSQNTEQGMMLTTGFENVSGSIHADFIYGNTGSNVLAGDLGNDTISGGDGNDIIYGDGRTLVDTHGIGGSGPITTWHDISTVTGDPGGNDTLLGGRGDDYLYGGRGDDIMTGNQGIDRFVVEGASGDDRITDFAVNTDKIVFSGVAGVDDFSDLTLTKVGSNTVISWGTSDSITLDGIKTSLLDAGDFEFGAAASASVVQSDARGSSFGSGDEGNMSGLIQTMLQMNAMLDA